MRHTAALALATTLIATSTAHASASPVVPLPTLNANVDTSTPAAASDGDGALVVWKERASSFGSLSTFDVVTTTVDLDGVVSPARLLSSADEIDAPGTFAAPLQVAARANPVVVAGGGVFLVVWNVAPEALSRANQTLMAAILDDSGDTLVAPFDRQLGRHHRRAVGGV
jgi:hypothetical protein